MLTTDDAINIIQLVVIVILAIICLMACYRVYCYRNLSAICTSIYSKRMIGGDNNEASKSKFKQSIEKLKALKATINNYRKPIAYFASEEDPKYTGVCYKLLTDATGVHMSKTSMMAFAKALGATSLLSFISACKSLAMNSSAIAEELQTFTGDFIPSLMNKLRDRNFIKDYIIDNFDDIKYALTVTLDKGWVTNADFAEIIKEITTTPKEAVAEAITKFMF